MSKNKNLEASLNQEIQTLEKEELRLFHSYNRHGTADFKLGILNDLSKVIVKLEVLKKIKQ